MVMLKLAWLLEQELPSKLLKVGTQLQALLSSSKDPIRLLDKVRSLLSQEYQNPSKSIQNALVPLNGVLILEVLTNQADHDVHISLASCLSKLIRIRIPKFPFEDELMENAFRVIVSSFQTFSNSADKSYHKRLRMPESISKAKSYAVQLVLEFNDLALDIFHHLSALIQGHHSPLLLAHIESIFTGILDEADDLLLEFPIFVLSRSQAMGCLSSTTYVMNQRVLEICASRIPPQQIISSMMHSKAKEVK